MTNSSVSTAPEVREEIPQTLPQFQNYASWLSRGIALVIDGIILLAPALFASTLFPESDKTFFILITMIVTWIYFVRFESSRYQATPGKILLGLKVTDLEGQKISFKRANARFFSKIISSAPLMLGFLTPLFTTRKQALHDMIALTLVLNK